MTGRKQELQAEIDYWNQMKADHVGNLNKQENIDTTELNWRNAELKGIEDAEIEQAIEIKLDSPDEEMVYVMDTLEIGGFKMIELAYNEEDYKQQRRAVQKFFLEQQASFDAVKKHLQDSRYEAQMAAADAQDEVIKLVGINKDLEITIFNQGNDIRDLSDKLRNASEKIAENEVTIKLQAKKLGELLENQAVPIEIKPLTADEEEAKWIEEKMGKRIKVTNMRLQFPDTFNTRDKLANNALTGELIEFKDVYYKRYEEISEEEAEQLRAEYAIKKMDLEKQFNPETLAMPATETFQEVSEPVESEEPSPDLFQGSMAEMVQGAEPEGNGQDSTDHGQALCDHAETPDRRKEQHTHFGDYIGEDRRTVNDNVTVLANVFTKSGNETLTVKDLYEFMEPWAERIIALENSPRALKESA